MFRAVSRVAIVVALLACAAPARPDGGEDGAATDDLLCVFRQFYGGVGNKWGKASRDVPWTDWWFANRRNLIGPPPRLPRGEAAGPVRDDAAARDRARTVLLGLLDSKDRYIASEAALAIGRAGDARDIAALAKILEDDEIGKTRRLHRYAAIGIGLLPRGDADQAATARKALLAAVASARGGQHEYSFYWTYCAYSLAMRGDAAVVPELTALRERVLRAPNAETSMYTEVLGGICYALGVLGGELSLPEVQEHLGGRRAPDRGNNDTSWAATQALARIGGADARALLIEAAGDTERWTVRAGALHALGALATPGDDDVAELLRETIADDRKIECRRMAAISLGRSGHPSAKDALAKMLAKDQLDARPFAALGLGFLARRQADPALTKMLLDSVTDASSDDDQAAAALACGLGGVTAARPRLASILEHGSPTASPAAAWALGALGADPDERKILRAAVLRPGRQLERREAALALAVLGDRVVVDELRAAVSGRGSDLERGTAAILLGRIGDDTEIDFLLGELADKQTSDPLAACLVHALGWLLDRDDLGALARVTSEVRWDKHTNGNNLSWSGEALWDLQHLVD